jgi:hypothetical protein
LRALISSTRSDINPRVGFELLSETQLYGQAIHIADENQRMKSLKKRQRVVKFKNIE